MSEVQKKQTKADVTNELLEAILVELTAIRQSIEDFWTISMDEPLNMPDDDPDDDRKPRRTPDGMIDIMILDWEDSLGVEVKREHAELILFCRQRGASPQEAFIAADPTLEIGYRVVADAALVQEWRREDG